MTGWIVHYPMCSTFFPLVKYSVSNAQCMYSVKWQEMLRQDFFSALACAVTWLLAHFLSSSFFIALFKNIRYRCLVISWLNIPLKILYWTSHLSPALLWDIIEKLYVCRQYRTNISVSCLLFCDRIFLHQQVISSVTFPLLVRIYSHLCASRINILHLSD